MPFIWNYLFQKLNNKALCPLAIKFRNTNSRKNSVNIDVIFGNRLENNDTPGNKENTVYC